MRASTALAEHPVVVGPSQTIAEVVATLRSCAHIRAAVVEPDGKLIGVLGMHDVLSKLLPSYVGLEPNLAHALGETYLAERYAKLAKASVGELMLHEFASVSPDSSLARVIAVMSGQQWEPLPVVEQGRFVGMITRASVLAALAESAARLD